MGVVANILLTHQPAVAVDRMVKWWARCVDPTLLLIIHGGRVEDFQAVQHGMKRHVIDARLRTRDHQREKQGYGAVWRAVADWLQGSEATHVHFAEYDQLPLVNDLNERQLGRLASEDADVLGYHLRRVDRTSHGHWEYHVADPAFAEQWRSISKREDASVVLSMFGSGSFWTREAFCAVAAVEEITPVYLELFLPTAAHHLGFRVRNYPAEQNPWVQNLGDFTGEVETARRAGAWAIHPVKGAWDETPS